MQTCFLLGLLSFSRSRRRRPAKQVQHRIARARRNSRHLPPKSPRRFACKHVFKQGFMDTLRGIQPACDSLLGHQPMPTRPSQRDKTPAACFLLIHTKSVAWQTAICVVQPENRTPIEPRGEHLCNFNAAESRRKCRRVFVAAVSTGAFHYMIGTDKRTWISMSMACLFENMFTSHEAG